VAQYRPFSKPHPPAFSTVTRKENFPMSLHSSLKGSSTIQVKRNVMKRHERINKLMVEKRWKAGDKVFGLPKTKSED